MTMNTDASNPDPSFDEQPLPWYRYGWPWFLISFPCISIALGSVMLFLAFGTNNSLVVDDYYKQGKAINVRIEKDRVASLLGLQGELNSTSEGLVFQMQQNAPEALPAALAKRAKLLAAGHVWPETLLLRWVHVTQAQKDGQVQMTAIGGGRFIAQSAVLPADGKFRLHIQPLQHASRVDGKVSESSVNGLPDETLNSTNWRLISGLESFASISALSMQSPLPRSVYNDASWQ